MKYVVKIARIIKAKFAQNKLTNAFKTIGIVKLLE